MLPDRVLAFEESPRERFIDHRYLSRSLRVLLLQRPAPQNLRVDRLEEPWHYPRPARTGVLSRPWLRPPLDANPVVPAVAGHRRIKCRCHHPYPWYLHETIVDSSEHRLHLLR